MNIAIIGYGRMGKTIENIARERGHKIVVVIDVDNEDDIHQLREKNVDVAIEFTQPESAYNNITTMLQQEVSVVSGTTGWLDKMQEVTELAEETGTGFFYAPNYSVGVNLFFAISEYAAELMNKFPDFDVHIEEVHHIHKLDSPSGTAIHLANEIIEKSNRKSTWINEKSEKSNELSILSDRKPDVPGIHSAVFSGEHDVIELKHTASSRLGFATGAVLAAEYLNGKKGNFSMKDLLNIS